MRCSVRRKKRCYENRKPAAKIIVLPLNKNAGQYYPALYYFDCAINKLNRRCHLQDQ